MIFWMYFIFEHMLLSKNKINCYFLFYSVFLCFVFVFACDSRLMILLRLCIDFSQLPLCVRWMMEFIIFLFNFRELLIFCDFIVSMSYVYLFYYSLCNVIDCFVWILGGSDMLCCSMRVFVSGRRSRAKKAHSATSSQRSFRSAWCWRRRYYTSTDSIFSSFFCDFKSSFKKCQR